MTIKQLLNSTSLTKYGNLFSSLNVWKKLKVMKLVFNSEIVEVKKIYKEGKDMLTRWWGIGRTSFVVMPRVLMEEMPVEWQGKMADLMKEWDDKWDLSGEEIHNCGVRFTSNKTGRMIKTPEWFLNYENPNNEIIEKMKKK